MSHHRHVLYAGRVQGVGFRYSVKQIAEGFEVIGWVRNLPDGRVELQVGGTPEEVEEFLGAIAQGQLARYIKEVQTEEAQPFSPGVGGFEIRI